MGVGPLLVTAAAAGAPGAAVAGPLVEAPQREVATITEALPAADLAVEAPPMEVSQHAAEPADGDGGRLWAALGERDVRRSMLCGGSPTLIPTPVQVAPVPHHAAQTVTNQLLGGREARERGTKQPPANCWLAAARCLSPRSSSSCGGANDGALPGDGRDGCTGAATGAYLMMLTHIERLQLAALHRLCSHEGLGLPESVAHCTAS